MSGEDRGFVHRWRWVALYTLVLLASVPTLPYMVSWIYRHGMVWILRYTPGIVIAGGLCWLAVLYLRSRREVSILWLGAFLALSAVYGFFLFHLSTHPVERFHLLQYGLLAFLWIRVLDRGDHWVRAVCYTLAGVLFVGFFDELLQGFLPRRYYDPRDVALNAASGVFGIALYFLFRGLRRAPAATWRPGTARPAGLAAWRKDLACVLVFPCVLAAMFYIQQVPFDKQDLLGSWERPSRCGGMEWLSFSAPDRFSWWDEQGNVAHGRYGLRGNRLDSAMIDLTIEYVRNSTRCGIRRKGGKDTLASEIDVEADHLYLDMGETRPYRRVDGTPAPVPDALIPDPHPRTLGHPVPAPDMRGTGYVLQAPHTGQNCRSLTADLRFVSGRGVQ